MKLKAVLRELSTDQLEAIMDLWGIHPPHIDSSLSDANRRARLAEHLYPRLQMSQYFLAAFDKLSDEQKDLVYFLCIHGGDLPEGEVLERMFNGDKSRMGKVIAELGRAGFVFVDDLSDEGIPEKLVGVPEPYLRYIPLPAHWQGYLGYFLQNLSVQQLRQIAHGLGLKIDTVRKNYLIYRIRNELLDPAKLRKHVASLAPPEREMFRTLLARKGVCVYRDLLDTGFQKRYDHSKAEFVNSLLSSSGLLFTAALGDNKYNNLLMIPRDVFYIIDHGYRPDRRSLRELDTVTHIAGARQPSHILDNSNNLLRDLIVFAAYINRNTVKRLSSGGIGKNDLKKIVPLLSAHKTAKYAAFLGLFLISNKFLVGVDNIWRVNQTFLRWLEDARKCYQDIYEFWLETNLWNEEHVDGDIKHSDASPTGLVNAPQLRKLVLENIASIPTPGWIQFTEFAEYITPQLEMSIPKHSGGRSKWSRSNRAILESVIGETLYWMGLVSLGLHDLKDIDLIGHEPPASGNGRGRRYKSPARRPTFLFQLTSLGRFILDGAYDEPKKLFQGRDDAMLPLRCEAQHFIVQPNLEIITPPDLDLRTFYRLNEFCDIKAVDVMSTLVMTRDSLREGMDKGLRGGDILKFLSEHSQQEVPETVRHLVQECSDKHGEIDLCAVGGYIRVTDRILLEELRSHRRIQPMIKEIVGDNLLLLKEDADLRKLAHDLQRLGFMPRVEMHGSRSTDEKKDRTYEVTLSRDDLYTLLALLNYCLAVEEEMGVPLTGEKVPALLERLRPEGPGAFNIMQFSESIGREFAKKFQAALRKRIEDIQAKYKRKVSRLVSVLPAQAPRTSFQGPNPATEREDMLEMADFASEQEVPIEIVYDRIDREPLVEKVLPKKIVGDRIYGYSEKRQRMRAYRLERIKQIRLLAQEV